MMRPIPCTLMRGGTSKGPFFRAADLPADPARRDRVLLAAMGSPDLRQIDGLGGAHPLTSKVAVVGPPSRPDADVDYLFLQVVVDQPRVDSSQNCGNMLAGVGPFALEHGLARFAGDVSPVRIHMVNTKSVAVAQVQTADGQVAYDGDARIDGVPGTAAPVSIEFLDVAGSSCGRLLPTGRTRDVIDGIEVTCIDNGMPCVILHAGDVGCSGAETPAALEGNAALKQRIETLRLACGPLMNLGDVANKTVPKMVLVSAPRAHGTVATRSFIPHRVHEAIGVLGAVSVATACLLPDSVASDVALVNHGVSAQQIDVEHPTGFFSVDIEVERAAGQLLVRRSSLLRTCRKLMSGEVYVPEAVWNG